MVLRISIPSSGGQEGKLLEAAKAGRVEEVAALLEKGVHIQCKDQVRLCYVKLSSGDGLEVQLFDFLYTSI